MRLKPVGAFIALAAFCLPAAAQRIAEQQQEGQQPAQQQQQTKVVPAMTVAVMDRFTEAQTCMDEDDLECAVDVLDRVAAMRTLNNYERAYLWNFRAFVYFDQDNIDGAIEAYESLLEIPFEDMPDGLIQGTMRNLSQLYLQQERWEEGLEMFMRWMDLPTVTPSGDDYYMLATIYYSLDRHEEGLPAIQRAIELANAAGEIGEERWHQLLYVFYYELEQTAKVIETLTFLAENWTKKDWVIALAQHLSGEGRDDETLALYQAAYEAGWLTRGSEWTQLANMYLNADAPYNAAVLLEKGLGDGTIESTEVNWRTLATAWQLAADHEKAIPALERASALSDDGDIDRQLASSYIRLARWEDCVDVSRRALERGGVDRTDLVYVGLGNCLMNLKQYEEARTAFQQAARDDRSAQSARDFIRYTDTLIERERNNREALASLEAD